jgi:Domain of unknown function (DUF4349)
MRRHDNELIDPDVAASLDAIDATLAGEPVDPKYAELAELALLLRDSRPVLDGPAALELDRRVESRFSPAPTTPATSRKRRWTALRSGRLAAAGLLLVVVVAGGVGLSAGGLGSSSTQNASVAVSSSSSASLTTAAASAAAPRTAPEPSAPQRRATLGGAGGAASQPAGGSPQAAGAGSTPAQGAPGHVVQPPNNGRKITQSAQLTLSTAPARIDDVAQELFDVIGAQNGIVNRSTVTATGGPDGYAQFQLTVPSANLAQTMAQLSSLRYANVVSRTDASQDVNNQYVGLQNQLADAQALRTSLLKQLANAATQEQIDSLNGQLQDAEATIASAQAQLRSLNQQINYSQVSVTINADAVPVAHSGSGSGFTIGKGAHDAGRVLTVVAGGALIALAALLPVALVIGLGWWITATLRRRAREHALDTA